MPKQRVHLKNFEDFSGLDEKSSDLTRPRDAAKTIDNFELNRVFSLGGRKGFKFYAHRSSTQWLLGIHNYIYQDENGATQEELIGIDNNLWRLKEDGTFVIAYAGAGTTYGYELLPHSSGDYFQFRLFVDGSAVLTRNIDGGAVTSSYSTPDYLSDLETAIEAISGFTVTITGGTGWQAAILPISPQTTTNKGTNTTIPFAYWEQIDCAGAISNPFQDFYDARFDADFKNATFHNSRNVCYIATGYNRLMKYDGHAVYTAGLRKMGDRTTDFLTGSATSPADIYVTSGFGTGLTGTFYIFATFAYKDNRGNLIRSRPSGVTSVTLSNSVITARVRCYALTEVLGVRTSGAVSGSPITLGYMSNDHISRLGYPKVKANDYVAGITYSGGAFSTPTTGAYSEVFRRLTAVNFDAKSISVDGASPSSPATNSYFYLTDPFANYRFFYPTSTQTNVAAGTNLNGIVQCKVGDTLFFPTSKIEATVTEVGASTIKVDKQISTTNTELCGVIRVEFWRTKAGATQTFYKFAEICSYPITSLYDQVSNNNVGDDDLQELYIDTGKYADDPYWKPSIVTEHQGQLITSGDKDYPNRVFFEDLLTPEGFQHSTNYFDVPSSESGAITACWSDDFNQLAVFKEHSYFNVVGDLTSELPAYSIVKVTENDYGIASQNSLVKFRGVNVGIGELGFIAFKSGQIDFAFGEKLSPVFLLKSVSSNPLSVGEILRVKRSIIINDNINERIICFIPGELYSSSPEYRVAYLNSKIFVYDYSDNMWFNFTFPQDTYDSIGAFGNYLPAGGMALYNGRIVFADKISDTLGNTFSRLYRFHANSTNELKYDYADNTEAINYDLWVQWESLDEPAVDKIFDWLKIYCFDSYLFVPFTLRVRTYINFNDTTTIDDFTLSFSASTIRELKKKLKATKARNLSVRLTVNTVHSKPTITGIEMTSALPYSTEKVS